MARAHPPALSDPRTFASPAARLTAEFREMPGLRLTTEQTAKLIGVDVHTASALLTTFVQRGFLRVTPSGYVLA